MYVHVLVGGYFIVGSKMESCLRATAGKEREVDERLRSKDDLHYVK